MSSAGPRVLIVKLGALGDVLLALPVAKLVRAAFPSAHLTWLVEERNRPLLVGNGEIDEVLVARGDRWRRALIDHRSWREMRDLFSSLRRTRFDAAIDLQGLFKSALWTRASGAPLRIGLPAGITRERGSGWAMTHRGRELPAPSHVTDQYLEVAREAVRRLGGTAPASLVETGCVVIESALRSWAESRLEAHGLGGRLVVMNPGAGWVTKRWPQQRFAELARRLSQELDLAVFVAHGEAERELAREVVAAAATPRVNTFPSDVRELAAIVQRASLFVGGDTGPYHLARDLGVPTLGLFGATDPRVNGPRAVDPFVWGEASCRPCYARRCPTAIECMHDIAVTTVFAIARARLHSDRCGEAVECHTR